MKLNIQVLVNQAPPKATETPRPPKVSIEEKTRHAVECLETHQGSEEAFNFLSALTQHLSKCIASRQPTEKEINLIRIARPALELFALEGRLQMPDKFWEYFGEVKNAKD